MGVKSFSVIVLFLFIFISSVTAFESSKAVAQSINPSMYIPHYSTNVKTPSMKNIHMTVLSSSTLNITSIDPPNYEFYNNQSMQSFTVTLTTNIPATCYATNDSTLPIEERNLFNITGGTTHQVSFSNFEDGYYYWSYFRCQDSQSVLSEEVLYIWFIDYSAPTMMLLQQPEDTITENKSQNIEAKFSDKGLGFFEDQSCFYCIGPIGFCNNNSNWNMTQNTFILNESGWYFNGTCSQSFNTSDYANGQYEFGIWIGDMAHNGVTEVGNFTIDRSCHPNWVPDYSWSQCLNGSQYKEYIDLNNCGLNDSKPANLVQQCDSFPPIITFNYADNSTISSQVLNLVATTDEMAYCWQSDYYEYPRDDTVPPNISVVSPIETINESCVNIVFHTNERADCQGYVKNSNYNNMSAPMLIQFSRSEVSLNDYIFTYTAGLYGPTFIEIKCKDLSGNIGNTTWNFINVAFGHCSISGGGGGSGGGSPLSLTHNWNYNLNDYYNYLIEISCSDNSSNVGHQTITLNTDFCTPNWTAVNTSCQSNNTLIDYYVDENDCFAKTNSPHDLLGKPDNTTYACDYCTPSWTIINTSCQSNNKIIGYYNDTNNCFAKTNLSTDLLGKLNNTTYTCDYCTPNWQCAGYGLCQSNDYELCNKTLDSNTCYNQTKLNTDLYSGNYSEFNLAYCDYNNDGIIGNISDMNTTNLNITITIDNGTIHLMDENNPFIEFDYDLTQNKLNLFNITIEKQNDSSIESYIMIKGIDLTGLNKTKTVYLNRKLNGTGLCIKDMEVSSIAEVSSTCTDANEIWISCPGATSGYNCSLFNNNTEYRISGLKHSAVQEQSTHCGDGACNGAESCNSCSIDCGNCPAPTGGGGGGGSGGGSGGSGGGGGGSSLSTDILFNLSLEGATYSPNKNQNLSFEYGSANHMIYISYISNDYVILHVDDTILNVSMNQSVKYMLNSNSILDIKLLKLYGSSAAGIFIKLDKLAEQENNITAPATVPDNSLPKTTSTGNTVNASNNLITGNVVNNPTGTGKIKTAWIIAFVVFVVVLAVLIFYLRRHHKHSKRK